MNARSKFKILIIDTYYPGFLRSFYQNHVGLGSQRYEIQKKSLLNQCFGTSDYYSFNLKKLGCQAEDLIVNNEILQRQWAREHDVEVGGSSIFSKIQMLPFFHRFIGRPAWIQKITLLQVQKIKPDIVYMQDLSILNPDTLREVKKKCKLLVGQIACPLPSEDNLKEFNLILTSFPHYVDLFRKKGISSEYFKIGFESRVLDNIGRRDRIFDVGFIGSFSPHHRAGTELLERVAEKTPVHIWGQGVHFLSPNSPLRKNYHGEVWGLEMYRILAQTKIVLNRHISVSGNYANNMRLYESTGMGAMLITDEKKNLNDLFVINKEVVSYKSAIDLTQKIEYYLKHDTERQKIAEGGQKRTLHEHTYQKRMAQLISILNRYF